MTCLFIRSHKIICNHCNNYFDWLISVAKELLYLREAVSVLFGKCKGFTFNHYIFIISQLWLTPHPTSTVVLPGTETPGTSREIYSEDAY